MLVVLAVVVVVVIVVVVVPARSWNSMASRIDLGMHETAIS